MTEPLARPLTRHWTPLAVVYLVLAVLGFLGTWTFNVLSVVMMSDFVADIIHGGPSVTSFTIDLLVAAIAGAIFIVVEARRLGMRHGWLYLVFAAVIAFAFAFPLFLALRQRRLTELATTLDDGSTA